MVNAFAVSFAPATDTTWLQQRHAGWCNAVTQLTFVPFACGERVVANGRHRCTATAAMLMPYICRLRLRHYILVLPFCLAVSLPYYLPFGSSVVLRTCGMTDKQCQADTALCGSVPATCWALADMVQRRDERRSTPPEHGQHIASQRTCGWCTRTPRATRRGDAQFCGRAYLGGLCRRSSATCLTWRR